MSSSRTEHGDTCGDQTQDLLIQSLMLYYQIIAFHCTYLNCVVTKQTIWFLNRSDTNGAVQAQKMARGWKFFIKKVEELYYPCSENKGVDQLRSYCEADLRL